MKTLLHFIAVFFISFSAYGSFGMSSSELEKLHPPVFIVTTLDQVTVTAKGIYVELDGILRSVESITLANDGYVVAIPKPQVNCPVCDFEVYESGGQCPSCGFPYEAKKSL